MVAKSQKLEDSRLYESVETSVPKDFSQKNNLEDNFWPKKIIRMHIHISERRWNSEKLKKLNPYFWYFATTPIVTYDLQLPTKDKMNLEINFDNFRIQQNKL